MFKADLKRPGDMFLQMAQSQTFQKDVRKELFAIAREALREIRGSITKTSGSGRESRGKSGRRRRASAPGEPPAKDTGTLAASLKSGIGRKSQGTRAYVIVRSRSGFYGRFLEDGTKNIAPRPFVAPVTSKYEPVLEARMIAVQEALKNRING